MPKQDQPSEKELDPPLLYLDYSASSPTPAFGVAQAVHEGLFLANSGRGGHGPALTASRRLFDIRESVANMLGAKNETRMILSSGATHSLNLAIFGLAKQRPDGCIFSTDLEHNSVARPLEQLRQSGRDWITLGATKDLFCQHLQNFVSKNPTAFVVVNHVSNVSGQRQNLDCIRDICTKYSVPLIIDAAQSLGCEPLLLEKNEIICASGHKGLAGPKGTGILALGESIELPPILFGGTGSRSEELEPPLHYPDRLEVGTANLSGLSGLGVACDLATPKELKRRKEQLQAKRSFLYEELMSIDSVSLYSPKEGGSALSFSVAKKDIGLIEHELWNRYHICLRVGLHCAPLAHKALGSFPTGLLRVSPSWASKEEDLKFFCEHLKELLL